MPARASSSTAKSNAKPTSDAEPARPSGAETTDHLQAAGRELLAAARGLLDIVEDVLTDREKLEAAAASVTELLGTAGESLATLVERVGAGRPETSGTDATTGTDRQRSRVRKIDID